MNAGEKYIRRAIELAERAMGSTFPNPLVGAVVVRDGEIVGEGYHEGPGRPHAEAAAIRAAGDRSRGATLYLNLEPCCHYGRTPPCTGDIIAAGIARVVFSMYDPDERVRGKGAALLRSSGIAVEAGLGAREALELNLPYTHRCLTGEPFVVLKFASTLDGRLTWGDERRLSGDAEQRYVHRLRAWTEAIAIGIGTVEKDAPRLDRRLFREDLDPPVRMVFDSELRFPCDYAWLERGERVIIYCSTHGDRERRGRLEAAGAEIVSLPAGTGGVDLEYWLEDVVAKGITSVLVEGGGEVATSFIREGFFERLVVCYAPLFGGGESVSWYQGAAPPEWLADEGLVLSRLEALDNDIAAVYDTRAIAFYLETLTREEKIVHWAD
jgi:diaminohydroxyphosphoribosylaminopyrimidine deaminase/5-amino-6-(5-phosphoribosylamino)uracil reductase